MHATTTTTATVVYTDANTGYFFEVYAVGDARTAQTGRALTACIQYGCNGRELIEAPCKPVYVQDASLFEVDCEAWDMLDPAFDNLQAFSALRACYEALGVTA